MGFIAEKRICELEDRTEEITQNVTQRDTQRESMKRRLRDMENQKTYSSKFNRI